MPPNRLTPDELIAKAQEYPGFQAGLARVREVLDGPSYHTVREGSWQDSHPEEPVPWLPEPHSLLVLAMHHPPSEPRLDWFERGNTPGNRRMQQVSEELVAWLQQAHGVRAQALPYQKERGGVYLKDAAVLAGLGVVGKNNLLLTPQWGPRVRLRAVLVQSELAPSPRLQDFRPCLGCAMPCHGACPQEALRRGEYSRPACLERLEHDRAHPIDGGGRDAQGRPILVTYWCRRCEFACPAGAG